MLARAVNPDQKNEFNSAATHPLQSWEWGEFRGSTGQIVERIGFFENGRLNQSLQATFHPLPGPFKNYTIGYFPKGPLPDENQLAALKQLGEKHNAIFIKIEPNVSWPVSSTQSQHQSITQFLTSHNTVASKRLFHRYTFQIDLSHPEETLFANLKSKTRYNIKVALKHGVEIFENTTEQGMEDYIAILEETTKRQGFYAHTPDYFRRMWSALGNSGIMHIFTAVYNKTILVSWIMFVFNGVLYYPYGASRNVYRETMASNLMLWEMIRFGKQANCQLFDLWGSLGPDASSSDPWYGFHRFKEGYGGTLVEFLDSYDMVLQEPLYKLYNTADNIRWQWLRLRAKLPF